MQSMMRTPNFFANGLLDRAVDRRGDAAWVEAQLQSTTSRILPVWQTRSLISEAGMPAMAFLSGGELGELASAGERIFLGLDTQQIAYFAADLSDLVRPEQQPLLSSRGRFADLREHGAVLPEDEAALLAYARGMVYWHARHKHCGVCGRRTAQADGGHMRICTDRECGASHFPRVDPAIIVLVVSGERCLLGRQPSWPAGRYSTLAGFVEPGESLEDAVRREIREEVGIDVSEIVYHSSQPWPFPSSLMLGFTAIALTERIRIDGNELEDARWFTRQELLDEPSCLPRNISISRRLIEEWLFHADATHAGL